MLYNYETYQRYWFPGEANERMIFDFTNDVMQIESPGFPLVPVDSDNFGNVITLPSGKGYYILGKYLMDSTFKTVDNSSGLFDNLPANVANCAFAPDVSGADDAHLYFIDSFGLNYAHIRRSFIEHSFIDAKEVIALPIEAMANSPLSIVGDTANEGCWLFYVAEKHGMHRLVNVYCKGNQVLNHSAVFLPCGGIPTSIDISKNNIAIQHNNATLVYGNFTVAGNMMDFHLIDSVANLSTVFIQSAFSLDGNTLFYLSEEDKKHVLNMLNLTTGGVSKSFTTGKYIALKRGLDNIIYGLSVKTTTSSTILTVTPNQTADDFSVSEFYSPVNGGYFPSTGWSNNPF